LRTDVCSAAEGAGFRAVARESIVQQLSDSHSDFSDKLSSGGDSILAQLSLHAFQDGIRALRAHAKQVDPAPVLEPIDVFVFNKP
jgi:hypothetical protein